MIPESSVLQSNSLCYRAFSEGDHTAMSQLWAERAAVTCLRPASPALVGRKLVLESWSQILQVTAPLELRCDQPRVHVVGEVAIVISCLGSMGDRL
jgi:hypothetical protein